MTNGGLTFLFTDIEGSTRLWEEDPDAMARALADHDRQINDTIARHGGRVFKTTGDGALAVFHDVAGAVRAAIAVQHWLQEGTVPVRMAIHCGQAEERAGDFFGRTLNRTARIMEAGWAGQVLLSETAARALREQEVDQAAVRDLGSHRLRDLAQPEHLFQLVHPDVADRFPPLRTLGAHPHNLPIQLSSFVGRERELEELRNLLDPARLITLTGAGGTGKTRLALQAAAEFLEHFRDGAWMVELASLSDPDLVPQAVAAALGLREQAGRSLIDIVLDYLRHRQLLIILDNCEHLIGAAARFSHHATATAAELTVMSTSREPLAVPGELIYQISSLDPAASRHLFLERAAALSPGFSPGAEDEDTIGQICERLDGIPLAIELAAARVRALSPSQIVTRLDDRFRLLTGGARTALPRQRTLEATVAWSYDLLEEPERLLFQRVSVFSGGFTLEAAEAVCGMAPTDPDDVAHLLAQLVDRSLVMAEGERYRMLETIRHYGSERLAASGEAEEVRRRHAEFFLAMVENMEPDERGANEPKLTAQLETEHDNFRIALAWCVDAGQAKLGLRLVGAVFLLWGAHSHATEGRRWARDMLAMAGEREPRWRAKALIASAWLSLHQGDEPEGVSLATEGIRLARSVADRRLEAWGLVALGFADPLAKDARSTMTEALAISQVLGDDYGEARAQYGLGLIAAFGTDFVEARQRFRLAVATFERLDSRWWVAWTLLNLARVAHSLGDSGSARERAEEARDVFQEVGDRRGEAGALLSLGESMHAMGESQEAVHLFGRALSDFRDLGVEDMTVRTLVPLAGAQLGRRPVLAVRLLAATAEPIASGIRMPAALRDDHERYSAAAQESLQPSDFQTAWSEGETMTISEAVRLALSEEGHDE